MAWIYWSDFTSVQTFPPPHAPSIVATALNAAPPGATGGIADLRQDNTSAVGHCIVGLSLQIPSPPAGVTFLFNSDTDLDKNVPANVRTFINNQLGINVPAGLTWRRLLNRLFTIDGDTRWGNIVGQLRLVFDSAGGIDL